MRSRTLPAVTLVAALLLAGCSSGGESEDAETPSAPDSAGPGSPGSEGTPGEGLAPPTLPSGRAWTYKYESFYDGNSDITVVVRPHSAGYLFAAGETADLAGEVLWGRPWYGPHDPHLADSEHGSKPFSFPLVDGKSWEYRSGLQVTAVAADVTTPAGKEAGFVIEGDDGSVHVRIEYAPSVGYFTSFLWEADGKVIERLTLKNMATAATSVWFEITTSVFSEGSASVLEVPPGQDAVLASAGAASGGRVTVTAPLGAVIPPWTVESGGEERWAQTSFAPAEGTWTLSALAGNGFAMGTAAAVRWFD